MATDDKDTEPISDPEEPISDPEEAIPTPRKWRAVRLSLKLNKRQAGIIAAAGIALAAFTVFVVARNLLETPDEPPGGQRAELPLVRDDARLMSPIQRDFLATFHSFLLDDHDIDYRVVTIEITGDIDRFAIERFEEIFADSHSETGRGLLLVVDPALDRVRLEVAFALEGVFPDAFVAYVEHRQMAPFFRSNRIADGILAATELIVARAQRAAANAGFESEVWATAGGGGQSPEAIPPASPAAASPANTLARTPAQALQDYFDALSARNADPDLPFYTPETRQMLRRGTVTRAQMDSVVKTYRRCKAEPRMTSPDGKFAVIRYPIAESACAPFFFRKVGHDWALDLTMTQQAVRFGRTNAWRFDLSIDNPYRFAFADWRFDKNGFPAGAK